jgi:hypothetical protein
MNAQVKRPETTGNNAMQPILPDQATSMRTLDSARRRRLTILAALVVVALVVVIVALMRTNLAGIGVDDFVEYWSAGRLNQTGGNPYSPSEMLALERTVGWDDELPVMMWNPPPTLALVMPFGALPYPLARSLWLLLSGALIVVAVDRLWLLYGGAPAQRSLALLLAVSFMPSLSVLRIGQIGVWIMIGVVGFLLFAHKERWLLAGALFALTTIKPHVAYLVWGALALWWFSKPRWSFAVGGVAVVAAAWGIATLVNPQVTAQYLDATLNTPPLYWRTMTWGSLLRLIFGVEREFLQLVAPTIGGAWLLYWWFKRRTVWNWRDETPRLLLVSASTMAFGWFFDLVVLLPVVVQVGVWLSQEQDRALRRTVLLAYAGVQVLALMVNLLRLDAIYYLWFTPSLLLIYLFYTARRQAAPEIVPEIAPVMAVSDLSQKTKAQGL